MKQETVPIPEIPVSAPGSIPESPRESNMFQSKSAKELKIPTKSTKVALKSPSMKAKTSNATKMRETLRKESATTPKARVPKARKASPKMTRSESESKLEIKPLFVETDNPDFRNLALDEL